MKIEAQVLSASFEFKWTGFVYKSSWSYKNDRSGFDGRVEKNE